MRFLQIGADELSPSLQLQSNGDTTEMKQISHGHSHKLNKSTVRVEYILQSIVDALSHLYALVKIDLIKQFLFV